MLRGRKKSTNQGTVLTHPGPSKEEQLRKEEIRRINNEKDLYKILGVEFTEDFDEQEIALRKAYLEKCTVLDPSQSSDSNFAKALDKLTKAYDTLCNPEERKKYNLEHGYEEERHFSDFAEFMAAMLGGGPARNARQRQGQAQEPPRARERQGLLTPRGRPTGLGGLLGGGRPTQQRATGNPGGARRQQGDIGEILEMFARAAMNQEEEEEEEIEEEQRGGGGGDNLLAAMLAALGGPRPTGNTAGSRQRAPQRDYTAELNRLHEMGFTNDEQNIAALNRTGGNLDHAVGLLVELYNQ